jgi:hypothetical protein
MRKFIFPDGSYELLQAMDKAGNKPPPAEYFPQSPLVTPEIEAENAEALKTMAHSEDRVARYYARRGLVGIAAEKLLTDVTPPPPYKPTWTVGEADDVAADRLRDQWANEGAPVENITELLASGASLGHLTSQQMAHHQEEISAAMDALIEQECPEDSLGGQEPVMPSDPTGMLDLIERIDAARDDGKVSVTKEELNVLREIVALGIPHYSLIQDANAQNQITGDVIHHAD